MISDFKISSSQMKTLRENGSKKKIREEKDITIKEEINFEGFEKLRILWIESKRLEKHMFLF
jgi:hypothetical protein